MESSTSVKLSGWASKAAMGRTASQRVSSSARPTLAAPTVVVRIASRLAMKRSLLGLDGGAQGDGIRVGGEFGGDFALGGPQQVHVILGRRRAGQGGLVVERGLGAVQARRPNGSGGRPCA